MRIFVCLIAQPENPTLNVVAVAAIDKEAAMVLARSTAAKQAPDAFVIGALTQEDVTGMGMLLAAGREALAATTRISA